MSLIPTPYLALGGALAICLAAASGFFYGVDAGKSRTKAEDAKEMAKAYAARDKAEENIQQITLTYANAKVARDTTIREITREIPKIVERPVYRNTCVDADGVRLLTRAAEAANGEREDRSEPTGGPAEATDPASKR